MMPVARRLRPKSVKLKACVARYEQQAQSGNLQAAWKSFRASSCGRRWFSKLEKSYGKRCMYCDHAPGRTIDHCKAKSKDSARMFRWSNWRLSCGDCNRLKNSRTLPDPVREDPRDFILFDVSTGSPGINPVISNASKGTSKNRQRQAEVAVQILDHQTLNDARRAKLHHTIRIMAGFINGEAGYDASRILAELASSVPNRAILRDLILDAELGLHQWEALVNEVVGRIPELRVWALTPLSGVSTAPPGSKVSAAPSGRKP